MSKLDTWIDNRIAQNLFIWFCLFLILLGVIQADNKIETASYIILLLAPAVYVNNLLILPFFIKSRVRFFILFLINTTVFTGISSYLLHTSLDQKFTLGMFLNLFGILILSLTFGSAIKISRDSFIRRQEEKNAELKLLKAQLNPHFLFNTLNNLYGLSVVKSDKLPNLMLKLSNLLRYSLYETREIFVPIKKEIEYLENYISLEKIRLEDQTEISLNINGNFEGKTIAPMLLIVFVENAFKHLGEADTEKSKVIIEISMVENQLSFLCKNTFDSMKSDKNIEKGKSGIGLVNAKKRLKLLYSDIHQLKIEKSKDYFLVSLNLEL